MENNLITDTTNTVTIHTLGEIIRENFVSLEEKINYLSKRNDDFIHTQTQINDAVQILRHKDKLDLLDAIDAELKDLKIKDMHKSKARSWIKERLVINGKFENLTIKEYMNFIDIRDQVIKLADYCFNRHRDWFC